MKFKCPGYHGLKWFGWFGRCVHDNRQGAGDLIEHICQHPAIPKPIVVVCPTRGKKP